MGFVEGFDHLLHAGGGGVDDVVGKEDAEGFVADDLFGHEDGVAEAEGFWLADVDDLGELGDGLCDFEEGGFVFGGEGGFELGGLVEVVFHGGLAAAGDDDDLGAAGGYGLFDPVLDEGLVDKAEHFFGGGLGCGEEAGSHACGWEDGFADFHVRHFGENPLVCCVLRLA